MNKVLFVIHYPVFGGPHNQALRLDSALRERGWDSLVVLPDEPGNAAERLRDGGVEVHTTRLDRLRAKKSLRLQWNFLRGFIPAVRRLRALIRESNADIVMIGGLVNPHAAIAARLEGRAVVWQLVDTRAPQVLVRLIMPLVKRLADAILVTGMAVAEAHPGAVDFGERLFPFFPPVDTDAFSPDVDRRRAARADMGLSSDDVVIGSVGNVNPQKDQLTFVRSAGELKRTHPAARFVIMGAQYPEHADYVRGLEEEIERLELELGRDVVFKDPESDVARHASALDLFWMTSEPRSEGIPTVIEEAMALGIPVISTDVGAVRSAVEDGVTGFVVPAKDPSAIANASAKLLDNPELRQQFSENARLKAVRDFSLEECAELHVRCFEAALEHLEEART